MLHVCVVQEVITLPSTTQVTSTFPFSQGVRTSICRFTNFEYLNYANQVCEHITLHFIYFTNITWVVYVPSSRVGLVPDFSYATGGKKKKSIFLYHLLYISVVFHKILLLFHMLVFIVHVSYIQAANVCVLLSVMSS